MAIIQDKVREQTISDKVDELEKLLRQLNLNIDELVQRNPMERECEQKPQKEANVFDEIIQNLSICRGLTREATEKIELGISQKVQ